jgi:ribonuclease VapC
LTPTCGSARRGARPQLNFGDCLSFAVARLADEPLLFTGDDFPQTDLALA